MPTSGEPPGSLSPRQAGGWWALGRQVTMDGEVHEISAILGELRAEVKSLRAGQDRMTAAIDALRSDHDTLKNRGLGLLIGVSLAGAVGGAGISKLLVRWLG